MPELPEVEVIRLGLAPRLLGRRFLSVKVGKKRLRQASSPQRLTRWLKDRRLERLERRGKYLVFRLEGDVTLLIHLGMTGRLLLDPPRRGEDWAQTIIPFQSRDPYSVLTTPQGSEHRCPLQSNKLAVPQRSLCLVADADARTQGRSDPQRRPCHPLPHRLKAHPHGRQRTRHCRFARPAER